MGVQVKLRNPLRTRAIPERFLGGDDSPHYEDALYQVTSVCTYTLPIPFMVHATCSHTLDFHPTLSGDGVRKGARPKLLERPIVYMQAHPSLRKKGSA